jgi:catechol 2,3-dioxygenase-like lactoylglutathione lyase family enzyme
MAPIGAVVLNVADIGRAASFWRSALGYLPREDGEPGALVPQSGHGPALLLDETDRTHLDLHVASEEAQQAEVGRLISLGAQRADWVYPEGADFVVLSDTEGNLYCVVNTGRG